MKLEYESKEKELNTYSKDDSYNKKYDYNLKDSIASTEKDNESLKFNKYTKHKIKEKENLIKSTSLNRLNEDEIINKRTNLELKNKTLDNLANTYIKNLHSKLPDNKNFKQTIEKKEIKELINFEKNASKNVQKETTLSRLTNKHMLNNFKSNQLNKIQNLSSKHNLNSEKVTETLYESKYSKTPIKQLKAKNCNFSPLKYKSYFFLEEKYKKLKNDYDKLKAENIQNKKLIKEITKKYSKAQKKEQLFNQVVSNFKEAELAIIKLESNYLQSEVIRKEQAKMIKSLQKEILNLKNNKDIDNNSNNK
jgi:hypothetical protein